MKKIRFYLALGLLSAASFQNFAQVTSDLTSLQELLDRHKYRALSAQIEQIPNHQQQPELALLKAKAMYLLQDTETLDSWMEQLLKDNPTHAQLHYIAALNKFNLAQEASIFSAAGYAKDGLALLKQAVALDPNDLEIQSGLIGFYSGAPSIAGGDEKEAQRLADAMFAKNPVQGSVQKAILLLGDDKEDEAKALIEQQLATQPQDVDLLEMKAAILAKQNQDKAAFELYEQAANLAEKSKDKYPNLYQVGRLAAAKQQDASKGIAALEQYINFYQGSDDRQLAWAKLRLAQIHFAQQNFDQAQALVQQLRSEKNEQEKFIDELKAFEKQLNKVKTS
jgi:tetratricopeptide (TPR) repeat protein